MSRAQRIYTVFEGEALIGCFTVKHEMITWIAKHAADYEVSQWKVLRCPDNPGFGEYWRPGEVIPMEDLL